MEPPVSIMDSQPMYVTPGSLGMDFVVSKIQFPFPLAQKDNTTMERDVFQFHHKLSTRSAAQDGTSMLLALAAYQFPLALHLANQMNTGMESLAILSHLGMYATQASDGTETAV